MALRRPNQAPKATFWFQAMARQLEAALRQRRPLVVGVFTNQPAAEINAVAQECGLDLVQLSGQEDWDECLAIARPVIKALHLSQAFSAAEVLATVLPGRAALCLLDADVKGYFGGSGQRLDWQAAKDVARALPVMLAGGLTPENVSGAIDAVRPWAVDVASGVESDGAKDLAKVRAFVERARLVSLRTRD